VERLLRLDPTVGLGVKEIEREDTAIQHLVVEGTQVKFGPQFLLGAFAEFAKRKLSELVT
jgi:hypothetical protein